MKKIIFLIPLLIIGQAAYADVVIQNDQKYIDNDGLLHIIGEIENNLKVPLNQIQISATLIDENDANIDEIANSTISNIIMPEMKGAFDILILDVNGEEIKDYKLNLQYKIAQPKNQVIEISSSVLTKDNHNNTVITGTISNKDGYFKLDKFQPGKYSITIEFIGYETILLSDQIDL